jgi:hypothetical protein
MNSGLPPVAPWQVVPAGEPARAGGIAAASGPTDPDGTAPDRVVKP